MLSNLIFYLPIINLTLALGGILLIIATVVLAVALYRADGGIFKPMLEPWLWPLLLATSGGGVLLSLLYSEVFLFIPCSLCWLQRIALYPQVLLALIAWRKQDNVHFPLYGIGLSLFGFLVAIYHYIYQLLPAETRDAFAPCLMDGTADCGDTIMQVFGLVTFPFISAATFVFLIVLYLYLLRRKN